MVRGCFKRLALLVVFCAVGVSASTTGEKTSCIADDGSVGYWPPRCEHREIEPRSGNHELCSCITETPTKAPKGEIQTSCTTDDGSRGFWPIGCEHRGIVKKIGNSCFCRKLVECGKNSHYCVYRGDCAVSPIKPRDDNCPLKDLVCCPKEYTREQITPYDFEGSGGSQQEETTEDPNGVQEPDNTTPASDITASDIFPLTESFVYTACGQRAKYGLVPHKTRNQQDRAEYGEIPWMAAIFQMPTNDEGSGNFRYCCNGALISVRAVVTTAHCVGICGGNVNKMLVRLGEWDLNSTIEAIPPKEVRVRKAHKHNDYVFHSLINNIAVLELASDVQYGPTIQPVCLPEKDYPSLTSRENLIFNGWGKTVIDSPSSNGHNFLKSVILRNNERSICKAEMKSYDTSHPLELHPSFVCGTKVHEEQPCRGDAGAPVVVEVPLSEDRYYIHGLVSWGYDCTRPDRPNTALTNVRGFRVWINQTLTKIAN